MFTYFTIVWGIPYHNTRYLWGNPVGIRTKLYSALPVRWFPPSLGTSESPRKTPVGIPVREINASTALTHVY